MRVRVEPEPRGTAGALISALDVLEPRFMLLNGDLFFDINIRALAAEADANCEALIALRCEEGSRYGWSNSGGTGSSAFVRKQVIPAGRRLSMPASTY